MSDDDEVLYIRVQELQDAYNQADNCHLTKTGRMTYDKPNHEELISRLVPPPERTLDETC